MQMRLRLAWYVSAACAVAGDAGRPAADWPWPSGGAAVPRHAADQASPGQGAPSFSQIAAEPSATEMSLRVFLRTPHPTMPN